MTYIASFMDNAFIMHGSICLRKLVNSTFEQINLMYVYYTTATLVERYQKYYLL